MRVAVAGAGKVGRFVTRDLLNRGHEVLLIEMDQKLIEQHKTDLPCTWIHADACEPYDLRGVGLETCDVMVAATGDDEDNVVTSLLAKQEFGIPRVLARVNHPANEWLFNESWGVDVPVSPPHLLASLVDEAVTVGDLVTLLRLEQGRVLLVEFKLDEASPAVGKVIGDLTLPRDCALVAIVRSGHVIAPREETPMMVGDEILALSTPDTQGELEELLSGVVGGSDRIVG
ncbi:MAG TPA: TrkA family potassium uptake protein [Actinomycetota bacterium]|nr:TrkA family potassium uptake protein [Actinomycetota bacterium]